MAHQAGRYCYNRLVYRPGPSTRTRAIDAQQTDSNSEEQEEYATRARLDGEDDIKTDVSHRADIKVASSAERGAACAAWLPYIGTGVDVRRIQSGSSE